MLMIDYSLEYERWHSECKHRQENGKTFIGERSYRHFDNNIKLDALQKYVSFNSKLKNQNELSKHSFYPFIRNDKKVRRYKVTKNKNPNSIKDENEDKKLKKEISQKNRPIMYASHVDACIYSFYSSMLKDRYEMLLEDAGLSKSIIAYRKIPRDDGSGRGKSNIDYALEIKDLLKQEDDLVVMCLDISKFFDNMNHRLIKQKWSNLIGQNQLPIGHYTIYKNITNFRYVFQREAFTALKLGYTDKNNKFKYYSTSSRAGRICDSKSYRKYIDSKTKSLVHKNKSSAGIPQGSPISDIIANMYLLEFDKKIIATLKEYEFGYYRRYSDDILLICPPEKAKEIYSFALKAIKKELLTIKPSKTEAFYVRNRSNAIKDITYSLTNERSHLNSARQSIQYLGFEIDLYDLHLRSGTVANHYRRAKKRAKAVLGSKEKDNVKSASYEVNKVNRSHWQYFIQSQRRTGSKRILKQYHKVVKRAKNFISEADTNK